MTDILARTDPTAAVETLWSAAGLGDLAVLESVLADDVRWENVGLPAVHGRKAVLRVLSAVNWPGAGFGVKIHRITATGNTVMTERTDVIIVGPLHIGFWVVGVTEHSDDGKITLWRDYGDVLNVTLGFLRGLLGIVFPSVRPRL